MTSLSSFLTTGVTHLWVLGLDGYVERVVRVKRRDLYGLRYGKRESITLLTALYADPGSPRLGRKWRKWLDFSSRNRCAGGGS